jgi:hypothetical protein
MPLLLALEIFHVLFLLMHDWIPLGRLNDTAAVRAENQGSKLLLATLISTVPYAVGLYATIDYMQTGHPHWVFTYLWFSYTILFLGELNAWWIPYFRGTEPVRIERYRKMFGRTHAFLPERNSIRPNTLHVILHVLTLITLIVLATLTL